MEDTKQKLEALGPQINRILQISGSPGLSLGVLHKGITHTAHYGHRNAIDTAPANDDTFQSAASLSKPMAAVAIAHLVYHGKLDWDRPVRDYLPAFRLRKDEAGMKATVRDLLSLRTGIAPANSYWGIQNNEVLIEASQNVAMSTYIGSAKPYGQFVYSQWNYALLDDIVKATAGISMAEYMTQHIFRPLNMTRSSFGAVAEGENVAHTHCTYDNGTARRKPDATSTAYTNGLAAAAAVRCSIKDYLTFVQTILRDYVAQVSEGVDSTSSCTFPLLRTVFSPHVGLGPPERSGIEYVAYCLGMYRSKLPGLLSLASFNFYYALGKKGFPAWGKSIAGTDVYHQSGTLLGHLGALYMLPSIQTAVISFTNSQPLVDPCDLAAQLALSVLVGEPPTVDFVKAAEMVRSTILKNYKLLEKALEAGKTKTPPKKPLVAYQGDYYNAIHNFVISVTVDGDGLDVRMQRGKTGFKLLPYNGNTFYWPVNREQEMCEKGMWSFLYKDWHLFHFALDSGGEEVVSVAWRHDPYVSAPEVYRKIPTEQVFARM